MCDYYKWYEDTSETLLPSLVVLNFSNQRSLKQILQKPEVFSNVFVFNQIGQFSFSYESFSSERMLHQLKRYDNMHDAALQVSQIPWVGEEFYLVMETQTGLRKTFVEKKFGEFAGRNNMYYGELRATRTDRIGRQCV